MSGSAGQRPLSQRQIAGAEDALDGHLDVELGIHRRLPVDVSQEVPGLERIDHPGHGLIEARPSQGATKPCTAPCSAITGGFFVI